MAVLAVRAPVVVPTALSSIGFAAGLLLLLLVLVGALLFLIKKVSLGRELFLLLLPLGLLRRLERLLRDLLELLVGGLLLPLALLALLVVALLLRWPQLLDVLRWIHEERDLSPLPVLEHHPRRSVEVRLPSLEHLSHPPGELLQKVSGIFPLADLVGLGDVLPLHPGEDGRDVLRGVLQPFHPHNALENAVRLRVARAVVHHPRAIDQEDPLGQSDVLPHFGLTRNRSDVAHLFGSQGVDHGALPHVWVAHEPNGDGLLVTVQPGNLPQQRDERALAEGVGDARVEGQGRVVLGEHVQVPLGDPGGNQVALVEEQQHVLVPGVLLQVPLHVLAPRPDGVPRVQNLDDHIRGVYDLVKLAPDSLGLALLEELVLHEVPGLHVVLHRRGVASPRGDPLLVLRVALLHLLHEGLQVVGQHPWPLALALGPESVLVALHLEEVHLCLLAALPLVQERHGQLPFLEKHVEGGLQLRPELLPEPLQLLLPNDPRVPEPPPVRLNPAVRQLLGLERLGDELSLLVPLRLVVVHVKPSHRGRTTYGVGPGLRLV
mmetsp:Transcript_13133/g.36908  ORF Transcript_13133/g.36908 Transcript_13133/m.36908 type:complete len:547 (+) Transcript_13133:1109-2749(+)